MPYFNIVAQTNENTVVTEYEPVKARSDSYQSEAALENEFIRLLCEQGYEYLQINSEKDLIVNLRRNAERLNNYQFSETEWKQFFFDAIANPNEHYIIRATNLALSVYHAHAKRIKHRQHGRFASHGKIIHRAV